MGMRYLDLTTARRKTYVIHVAFEVASHGHFDERANNERAMAVANGTCKHGAIGIRFAGYQ